MNYRHIYHAGNFADVFKHVILCIVLDSLRSKGKPFCYIDTHAGLGIYDLSADEAARSPEYQHGIAKLLSAHTDSDELSPYITIVKSLQHGEPLSHYPGSPLIAAQFLGEHDQLILNEWHPDDAKTLKRNMKHHHAAHCHQRDAYEFLPAVLPPTPKRALILIDPPYEKVSEYDDIVKVLQKSLKRFETGIYMLWYPIVSDSHHMLVKQIKSAINKPMIHYEMRSKSKQTGLLGSGVIIINPPWKVEDSITKATAALNTLL